MGVKLYKDFFFELNANCPVPELLTGPDCKTGQN